LGGGFLGGSFFAEGAGIVFERWWVLVVEGAEERAATGGCEGVEFGSGRRRPAVRCLGDGGGGSGGELSSALWSAVGSRLNFLAQPRCVCRQTINYNLRLMFSECVKQVVTY